MKTIALAMTISLGVACLAGCASHSKPGATPAKPGATATQAPAVQTPAGTNVFSDEKARVSYAIGMTFGHNFQTQGIEVNGDMLVRGLNDMQSGGTTLLTQQEMRDTLAAFQKTIATKQQRIRDEAAVKNKAEGDSFLATNKNNPGVVTLPDGLQYKVITNGTGTIPTPNDIVTVNYRGMLIDGTEFDNSINRGKPAQISLGGVIPGWTEAITHMNVGSKWEIFVPSALAYGQSGRPPRIMPNSALIFEIELLATEPQASPATVGSTNSPLTSDIIKVPSMDEMKKGAKIEVIKPEDAAKLQQSQTNQPAK
jgi:FKBP-type peptidyl-prolyl cis-trans isomerase